MTACHCMTLQISADETRFALSAPGLDIMSEQGPMIAQACR